MAKDVPTLEKPLRNRIIGNGEENPDQLLANPLNWRIHTVEQQQALAGAIDEIGFIRSVTVNKRTGCVLDGHLRVALALRSGVESIPVEYVDLSEDEERIALATFDTITGMAATDKKKLEELLEQVREAEGDAAVEDERVAQMLYDMADKQGFVDNLAVPKDAKPNPRRLPLDVIYTWTNDGTCCMAVQAGLKYGINSTQAVICRNATEDIWSGRHMVAFVDNDYFRYDHQAHLAVVRQVRPKYCTVRDYMSEVQCAKAGIKYYPLEQILDWAEELGQYAENVIIIPKIAELDRIPEKFVLGYSVPSSHGSTPLPVEAFKGRRVHLLGGSWEMQLAFLAQLGDDVVSLDNNYVSLMASRFGQFTLPDGKFVTLTDYFEEKMADGTTRATVNNPRFAALAMSFGCMADAINRIYAGNCPVMEETTVGPIFRDGEDDESEEENG